ncbi:MAG: hypothetical protein NTY76_00115 [Candidatus Omnitrophica bacterium]|nr:hypothetical protein [Candidatus Omnitrophota bacterium]
MIDKKTEADIKALKSFLEFWTKFRSIYDETLSKDIISDEDEGKFLGVRDVIKSKYTVLSNSLDFKYVPRSRLTDPVEGVLAIKGIRLMSEKNLKKLNEDWRDSYVFLNSISERLKNKRKRLEDFNPIAVFFKRFFEHKGGLSRKG